MKINRVTADSQNVSPFLTHAGAQVSVTDADGNEVLDETCEKEALDGEGDEPLTMTTYMVVPPDGGWGWVVVAASFMCNLVVDGIIFTFGMLQSYLIKEWPAVAESEVALVGSLQTGFYLMAGTLSESKSILSLNFESLSFTYNFTCNTVSQARSCPRSPTATVSDSSPFSALSWPLAASPCRPLPPA